MRRHTGQGSGVLAHSPPPHPLNQAIFFGRTGLFCCPGKSLTENRGVCSRMTLLYMETFLCLLFRGRV